MNLTPKNAEKFLCEICNFICIKKSEWSRHVSTAKHKYRTELNNLEQKNATPQFVCNICNKMYKARNSLWYHQKKCNLKDTQNDNLLNKHPTNDSDILDNKIPDKELLLMLVKQNNELMDIIKKGTYNVTNNINNLNNNSHNKTFNLQFFLNETCKGAMNITEFINSINLNINDLEKVGQIGYAEGISKVFINNLNEIDYNIRPIHCSDLKREILYIKEQDKWSKEDNNKTTLTNAIKQIANKNIKQINEWQKLHPKYSDPDSKENDKYIKIVLNSMSGSTKEEANKNYEKIIKNIAKVTIIDK
jgi:hypothetical protein